MIDRDKIAETIGRIKANLIYTDDDTERAREQFRRIDFLLEQLWDEFRSKVSLEESRIIADENKKSNKL